MKKFYSTLFCTIPSLRYIFALDNRLEMEIKDKNPDKTVAALIHLSTFSQFFFPFGNFIFPLLLWMAKREDEFVNEHGKQALNFQISLFLYLVFLVLSAIAGVLIIGANISTELLFPFNHDFEPFQNPSEAMPILIFGLIMIIIALALFILNIYAVISATLKAGEGKFYNYPLTINFIRQAKAGHNQSKNEQFSNTQNQTL